MGTLYGKGVWLIRSTYIDLAIEMAQEIGATHIFYRTGHQGMFFPEAALRVARRARSVGLTPFAWLSAPTDHPAEIARIARRSAEQGYRGLILNVVLASPQAARSIETLGHRLVDAGLNPEAIYYSAPPGISRHPEIPYQELNRFCRGGMMPWCTPHLGKPPEVAIHKWTYEEHQRWSQIWGYAPPLYPVLSPCRGGERNEPLTPTEFSRWTAALAEHRPTFFSVFHVAATPRDVWPLLSELEVPRPPQPIELPSLLEPARPAAQPEEKGPTDKPAPLLITVQVSDTVRSLCEQYGCTKEQFWEWNGYLWDERGWPRDANYLQPGWRVRVR
ncbi:MAG TPA: LysM domain-containing protein [Chloroflexi bacterium]|nr:LysM domain-containing protein [Chloroflexota bacterium]